MAPRRGSRGRLVIGLFSASLVWGYAGTYASRAVNLLRDSFETGEAPQVTGVPIEPGHWSGDYAEIVGAYRGVKPASGEKMLRLVRADYEANRDETVTSPTSTALSISAAQTAMWTAATPG